jgi:hypothetical protein
MSELTTALLASGAMALLCLGFGLAALLADALEKRLPRKWWER